MLHGVHKILSFRKVFIRIESNFVNRLFITSYYEVVISTLCLTLGNSTVNLRICSQKVLEPSCINFVMHMLIFVPVSVMNNLQNIFPKLQLSIYPRQGSSKMAKSSRPSDRLNPKTVNQVSHIAMATD